ncbi:MAG: FixH family protein [Verrucomicrobia bacterium]|nr:FixH family protein [Verrucomicrobiota bacterium]
MKSILRNPWPYAITAWFVVFISGIVAWVAFAMRQSSELVRSDYYEHEIRYQQQIERLGRTQPVAAQATAAYDPVQQRITVTVPDGHAARATGVIHFYRPSDAKLDRRLPLNVDTAGTQTMDAKALRPGLWKVRVQWKVGGEEFFFDRPILIAPQS